MTTPEPTPTTPRVLIAPPDDAVTLDEYDVALLRLASGEADCDTTMERLLLVAFRRLTALGLMEGDLSGAGGEAGLTTAGRELLAEIDRLRSGVLESPTA